MIVNARKVPVPTPLNKKIILSMLFLPGTLKCWCSIAIHLTEPHITLITRIGTTGSNRPHAKPQKAVSYAKKVFSFSLCFLNSWSWNLPAECASHLNDIHTRTPSPNVHFHFMFSSLYFITKSPFFAGGKENRLSFKERSFKRNLDSFSY